MNIMNKDFGALLKTMRKSKRLTMRELAQRSDTSHSYLSQLENSKANPPKPNMIRKIATGLSLSDAAEEKRIYNALMQKAGYTITGSLIEAFTPKVDDSKVRITYRGENDSLNIISTDFNKVDQLFNLDLLLNDLYFNESTTNGDGLTGNGKYKLNLNYKGSELSSEQKKTLRYLLEGMHKSEKS